jgi:hypothetical protein
MFMQKYLPPLPLEDQALGAAKEVPNPLAWAARE